MLTNQTNLPRAIFDYLNNDTYSRGESAISVTALLDSPRVEALKERHADQITEDVADMSYRLLGNAIHEALGRSSDGEFDDKRRLFMDVLGWRISGQTDHAFLNDDGTYTIRDWKTGRNKKEHTQQLNCYRVLFESNGYKVSALEVIKIDLSWSPYKKATTPHSIYAIPIEMWELDDAYEFLLERVGIHQQARGELPDCTDEERWVEPDKYAVVKSGMTRAIAGGVCDTEEEAEALAEAKTQETGVGHIVELRPGDPEPKRCGLWQCPVARFCDQWQSEQ